MDSSNQIERRAVAVSFDAAKPRTLFGYAAVFGQKANIGGFNEVIEAGAFRRSLASGKDILCQVDHDSSAVLGRTSSGTLRLTEDSRGLRFELDVPETTKGRDIVELAKRGDLGGMSFGFFVPEGGEKWEGNTRILSDVELVEISVVQSFPAYSGTSVDVRSKVAMPRLNALRETLRYV